MISSNRLYTTTGAVQALHTEVMKREGRPLTFLQALVRLSQLGELSPVRPRAPFHSDMLSDDDFILAMGNLPVDATRVAHNESDPIIREDEIFPAGRDVFAFCFFHDQEDPPHDHDFFELTYVYAGSCVLRFEDETRRLRAGDLTIVAPHSRHTNKIGPDDFAISLLIRSSSLLPMFWNLLAKHDLLSSFFRNAIRFSPEANCLLLRTDNRREFKTILQRLVWESHRDDDYANSYAVSLVNQLLINVLRDFGDSAIVFRVGGEQAGTLDIAMLTQYIQNNYRTVTLASLADTFHYSEAYLSRVIQENLGRKFTDVIRGLKLSHAVEYLGKTSLKVSEIAELVGYSSADHFTRVFKAVYEMSPLDYRRQTENG